MINEEIIHYLEDMRLYWFFLVDNDKTQMAKITAQDVDNLQLLAPGISSADATLVKKGIFSGELFAGFELPTRMSIWGKLRNTKRIIPSFYTFFKDLNYLEPCANCIKRLVTLSSLRPTLQSAMRGIFQPQAGLLVQTSETDFHQHSAPAIDQFDLHYRQLWLYAMRHYPDIPRVVDSDDIVAKPRCQEADETVLFNMALLAKRLGFDSPQIRRLLEHSPDRKIARAALLKARKPDRYQYNARNFESLVSRIAECFSEAGPICKDVRTDIRYETKLKSRCGLPLIQSQRQDRHSMFLDTLQKGDVPNEISTFFVRKNVFSAFFGRLHAYISLKEPGLVPTSPTVRSEANGQTRDGKPRGENDLHEPEIAERPSLGSSCAGGEKGIHLPCKEAASHIYSEGSKKCQLTQEGVNSTSTDQEPLMERSSSPQLACASITTCVTEGFKAPEAGDASPCSKRPYRARSPGDGTELSLYYSEQNTLEASTTPQQQLPSDKSITIYFQCLDRGEWKQYHSMTVDPSDPSTVERMAKKSARNHGAFFYDKQLRTLSPAQCFEAAIEDGTNTIFMSLGGELLMTENMLASVSSYLDRPTGRLTTSPSV